MYPQNFVNYLKFTSWPSGGLWISLIVIQHQIFTWANVDPAVFRHMASLVFNELTHRSYHVNAKQLIPCTVHAWYFIYLFFLHWLYFIWSFSAAGKVLWVNENAPPMMMMISVHPARQSVHTRQKMLYLQKGHLKMRKRISCQAFFHSDSLGAVLSCIS